MLGAHLGPAHPLKFQPGAGDVEVSAFNGTGADPISFGAVGRIVDSVAIVVQVAGKLIDELARCGFSRLQELDGVKDLGRVSSFDAFALNVGPLFGFGRMGPVHRMGDFPDPMSNVKEVQNQQRRNGQPWGQGADPFCPVTEHHKRFRVLETKPEHRDPQPQRKPHPMA